MGIRLLCKCKEFHWPCPKKVKPKPKKRGRWNPSEKNMHSSCMVIHQISQALHRLFHIGQVCFYFFYLGF